MPVLYTAASNVERNFKHLIAAKLRFRQWQQQWGFGWGRGSDMKNDTNSYYEIAKAKGFH